MNQDRRITDKLPNEELVFTDRNLTAAALAHLEAERAAACLVHAGDDVWVGVGTKPALRSLLSEDTAFQSQSQAVPSELASLDHSEQYRMQMAAIGSAAFGYWTEEMGIKPEYDTVPLRDVARLYAKYEAARSYSAAAGVAEPAKDTPGSMANSNARFAIDGAIVFGREGVNKPSSEDHWLYEYWNIGQQLAKLGETSGWDNVTPVSAPLAAAVPAEEASESESEAVLLLAAVFDAWENGVDCYEAPESNAGYLGMAFKLDDDVFRRCCDLLNREAPPRNAPAEPAPIQSSALTNERIIEIADQTRTAESRDGDYILPISFAREIEKELARLSTPTAQGTATSSSPAQVTGEPASIDTPEFLKLAEDFAFESSCEEYDEAKYRAARSDLVSFINRHIAAQATAGRDAILEEAAKVCEAERVEETSHGDECYNRAIRHATQAIRALKSHAAEQASGGAK